MSALRIYNKSLPIQEPEEGQDGYIGNSIDIIMPYIN